MPRPGELTEDQRAVLTGLLRRPGLSNGQVAKLFEIRTGRRIARQRVHHLRCRGGYPAVSPNRHLTEVQREVLQRLIREAGPGAILSEVRARFEGVTGRAISKDTSLMYARMVRDGRGPQSIHQPSTRGNP